MKPRTAIRMQISVGVIFGILMALGTGVAVYDPQYNSLLYAAAAVFFVLNVIAVLLKNKPLAASSFCLISLFYLMGYLFGFFGSVPETMTQIVKILAKILGFLGAITGIALIGQGYFGLLNLERLDNDPKANIMWWGWWGPIRKELRINCTHCGHSLKGATKEMIGDIGVCPKCKVEFTIGQEDTEPKNKQKQ